jgi:hypothetical protein
MTEPDDKIPCGLYRTTRAIPDGVPANALVYYHNHGDPGPGVYQPRDWRNNQAIFHERGTTVPDAAYEQTLVPLPVEGFYRVVEGFHCCEQSCTFFEQDQLVQLGYNGDADPILFVPKQIEGALSVPSTGTKIDHERLSKITLLKVPTDEVAPLTSPDLN